MALHSIRQCAVRVLIGAIITVTVCMAGASRALSGQWSAALPPLGSGNGVTCGEGGGFSCALQNMLGFYGTPQRIKGCYYLYNTWGELSTAVCDGEYPAHRSGFASWSCAVGETMTGTDHCGAPRDRDVDHKQCKLGNPGKLVGNPVSATSGVKFETATDFTTAGDAALEFKRIYFSEIGAWAGPTMQSSRFGRGWRSNFDAVLHLSSTSSPSWVYAVLPDGRERQFSRSGSVYVPKAFNPVPKSWVNAPHVVETLTNVSSTWRLTLTDDTVYVFDSNGRLSSVEYRGGYTQTLTWDTNGKNSQISDNVGRLLTFTYNTNGLLSTMTDPDGKVYKYSYVDKGGIDALAQTYGFSITDTQHINFALTKVLFPDSTPSDDTDNPKVEYLYGDTNFPFALTGIKDERGIQYSTWTYDSSGRVATGEHAGGADHTSFSYDDVNSKTTVTNALSKVAVYNFNKNVPAPARLAKIEGQASTHCAAADVNLAYDSNGFFNQSTDGEGRVIRLPTTRAVSPRRSCEAMARHRQPRPATRGTRPSVCPPRSSSRMSPPI